VTQLDGAPLIMRLHLKHSNSIVQLLRHIVVLVREQVVDTDGIRIMGTDKTNISVTSRAEVGGPVASGCSTLSCGSRRERKKRKSDRRGQKD